MRVFLESDAEAALPVPYRTPGDPARRYYDIKRHPGSIARIRELRDCPELRALVLALNAPDSPVATLGCAHWEKPLRGHAPLRRESGAYVDVVFDDLPTARRKASTLRLHRAIVAAATAAPRGCQGSAVIRVQPQRVIWTKTGATAWLASIWIFGAGVDAAEARVRRADGIGVIRRACVPG